MDNSAGEPQRPLAVPKTAAWVGGPDGGVFVLLKARADAGSVAYSGTVYHVDGSVWYSGPFVLQPAGAKAVDPQNKRQFSGWDGTQILLEDGRSLVAKASQRAK
ncbi:hypothetical protein [Piscinibacter sp.]|uniref:hypothetical protein n=1 Tax=Piscinibacter sp. TaxID=1903157 RepID=UPI002ED3C82C